MRKLLGALILSLCLVWVPVAAAATHTGNRGQATSATHRQVSHRTTAKVRKRAAAERARQLAAAQQARKRSVSRTRPVRTRSKVSPVVATPAGSVVRAVPPVVPTPSSSVSTPATTAAVDTLTTASTPTTTTTADTPTTTTTADTPTTTTTASTPTTTTTADTPTNTTSTPATTDSGSTPVLGTFGISTPQQAADWKAAGGNAVVIPVYWVQAQPTQDGPVSLAGAGNGGGSVITQIQTARQDGLQVYLELSLQYPPNWVLSSVPEFVDQYGASWAQPTDPGADVRDWIWSAAGRQAVASFVNGAMADLQPYLGDISGIRAGGGVYGELDFPTRTTSDGTPSFWGYDSAAQSGNGLASGESSTPLPGYIYGTGTAAQDSEWANWYLGSLAAWITWYAQLLRSDGWNGPTYVLSPSYGMRTNMTPDSIPYEQQLAWGDDWGRMMDAYDQIPNVWPWCTWADDTEPYYHAGDTVDSDSAAWRKLLQLAQARGLASHIMGENTGGGGAAAIHQLMSGALASGYTGVFYLDYSTLVSSGLTADLVSQFDTYAS